MRESVSKKLSEEQLRKTFGSNLWLLHRYTHMYVQEYTHIRTKVKTKMTCDFHTLMNTNIHAHAPTHMCTDTQKKNERYPYHDLIMDSLIVGKSKGNKENYI